MLKIRLARGGAKKRPYYSIVVADSHSPRDGRFIEKVGTYNPLLPKDGPTPRVTLKLESIQAWIAKGAQPTDRVARFLAAEGIGQWAHGNNPNKDKPPPPGPALLPRASRARRPTNAPLNAPSVKPTAPPPPPNWPPTRRPPSLSPKSRPRLPKRLLRWKPLLKTRPPPKPLRKLPLKRLRPLKPLLKKLPKANPNVVIPGLAPGMTTVVKGDHEL